MLPYFDEVEESGFFGFFKRNHQEQDRNPKDNKVVINPVMPKVPRDQCYG